MRITKEKLKKEIGKKKKGYTYLVHKLLDPRPQLIFGAIVDRRERLVDTGCGGASHVCDEVREVLGLLEFDLARRLHLLRRYIFILDELVCTSTFC